MFCFYHFRQTNAPLGLGTYRALFTHCEWLLNLPKSKEKLGRWHTTSSKSKKQYTKHSLQLRGNRGWSTRIFRRHNSSPHLWTLNESLFIEKNDILCGVLQLIHWKKVKIQDKFEKNSCFPKIQSTKKT